MGVSVNFWFVSCSSPAFGISFGILECRSPTPPRIFLSGQLLLPEASTPRSQGVGTPPLSQHATCHSDPQCHQLQRQHQCMWEGGHVASSAGLVSSDAENQDPSESPCAQCHNQLLWEGCPMAFGSEDIWSGYCHSHSGCGDIWRHHQCMWLVGALCTSFF